MCSKSHSNHAIHFHATKTQSHSSCSTWKASPTSCAWEFWSGPRQRRFCLYSCPCPCPCLCPCPAENRQESPGWVLHQWTARALGQRYPPPVAGKSCGSLSWAGQVRFPAEPHPSDVNQVSSPSQPTDREQLSWAEQIGFPAESHPPDVQQVSRPS